MFAYMDFYRLLKIHPRPFPGNVRVLFSKEEKKIKTITANQIEHNGFGKLCHT